MRNTLVVALLLSGCATQGHTSRGLTRAEYQGGVHVVFTNASPVKMCELRMSSDAQPEYGDNWLPEGGLASGASLKLSVRPGTYKVMWSTCPSGSKAGYYAGTLWRDTAAEITADTQLYAYVAETVAPTKRAPLLGVDYTVIRFQGQPIGPIALATAHPPRTDAIAEAPPTKAARPAASFDGFIDPAAAKKSRHAKSAHPSLGRTHDVTSDTIAYHTR